MVVPQPPGCNALSKYGHERKEFGDCGVGIIYTRSANSRLIVMASFGLLRATLQSKGGKSRVTQSIHYLMKQHQICQAIGWIINVTH